MIKIDQAIGAFKIYKETYKQNIETDLGVSDTRSKLIDKVLIDVLGWQEAYIRREGSVDSCYYDL